MTILRLENGLAAELLLAHLRASNDVAAEALDEHTLSVSLVGSYRAEAMDLELELRLQAWQAALHAQGIDVAVEVVEDGRFGRGEE